MAKKGKGKRAAALRRWASKLHTRQIVKYTTRKFGAVRGRKVAVGLRAWALGISIKQLAKRGRAARKKKKHK